jgi:hypothetical protein
MHAVSSCSLAFVPPQSPFISTPTSSCTSLRPLSLSAKSSQCLRVLFQPTLNPTPTSSSSSLDLTAEGAGLTWLNAYNDFVDNGSHSPSDTKGSPSAKLTTTAGATTTKGISIRTGVPRASGGSALVCMVFFLRIFSSIFSVFGVPLSASDGGAVSPLLSAATDA